VDLGIHVCVLCILQQQFQATSSSFFLAVPEKTGGNILEHLSERRQGRHREALTAMYQELACIGRVRLEFVIQIVWSAILTSGPNIQMIRLTSVPF